MNRAKLAVRRGFTLVEMLVVIAIVGILAALITPALFNAMWAARQTKIKVEVDQLASAIEAFKSKYGSYPPANLVLTGNSLANWQQSNPALINFMATTFPRYNLGNLQSDLAAISVNTTTFYPDRSLVFWLSGFTADPTDPFAVRNTSLTRTAFYPFTQTQLADATNGYSAVQPLGSTTPTPLGHQVYLAPYGSAPYVYFDFQSYYSSQLNPSANQPLNVASSSAETIAVSGTQSAAVPYVLDNDNSGTAVGPPPNGPDTFAKPQSFQIISAGQDGNFGVVPSGSSPPTPRIYPSGIGYDPAGADDDNVTNFCEKNNLNDAKP